MNRDTVVNAVIVLLMISTSFAAGYQLHEPRVVTETETEIKTVETTETVVIEQEPEELVAESDYYYLGCFGYDDLDGIVDEYNQRDSFRLEYDRESGAFIAINNTLGDQGEDQPVPQAEKDRLLHKYCPDETFEGGESE